MMHAVKMKLVPVEPSSSAASLASPTPSTTTPQPDVARTAAAVAAALPPQPPTKPVVSKLHELNQQMGKVLQEASSTGQSLDETLRAFHQVLSRYRQFYEQYRFAPAGPPPPPSTTAASSTPSAPPDLTDEVVQSLPASFRSKGRKLMGRLKDNSVLSYDAGGQVFLHGHPIQGSNVLDLVHDALRPSKTRDPPLGWRLFAEGLKESNVPSQYVGNVNRYQQVLRQHPPTSSADGPDQAPLTAGADGGLLTSSATSTKDSAPLPSLSPGKKRRARRARQSRLGWETWEP